MQETPKQFFDLMAKRLGFNGEDRRLLRAHADFGAAIAAQVADSFYALLLGDEEMQALLNGEAGRVERLKLSFQRWYAQLFDGIDEWGEAYAQNRWDVSLIHVRLGVGPRHVVPAMAEVIQVSLRAMHEAGKEEGLRQALQRVAMIDLAFLEEAYFVVSSQSVMRETGWSAALFRRLVVNGALAAKETARA